MLHGNMRFSGFQRAQYPLIKESTLNHNIKGPYNFRYIPSFIRVLGSLASDVRLEFLSVPFGVG